MNQDNHDNQNNLYVCNDCNFNSDKLSNYKRHLTTNKHKNFIKNIIKNSNNIFLCDICNNKFNSRTSLWRHHKACNKNNKEYIEDLIYENKELHKKIQYSGNNKSCINININNFNIFLNNNCKNALSIQDFVKKIHYISINNVNNINKFNDYLVNLIINNMKPLSLTERPIHYKNKIRNYNLYNSFDISNNIFNNNLIVGNIEKEWYIKDKDNGWKEDDGNKIINTIKFGIKKKWVKNFEDIYPNWKNNDNLQNMYLDFVYYITSDKHQNNKKILKRLREFITLNI
jgi:hypothetical protein